MSEDTASIEKAKGKRTTAKGRFTRKRNFLIKSIENDQGIEPVETNYAILAEAYDELEGKHEAYIDLLPDEQSEEAEAWMKEIQDKFNDETNRKIKYVEQITLKEKTTREDAERREYVDKARTRRNTAHLFVEHKHRIGHHGVLTTASKVRTRYWIPKLLKLVKSIKSKCIICRKLDKRVSEQVMGNLPTDRLKPAPP